VRSRRFRLIVIAGLLLLLSVLPARLGAVETISGTGDLPSQRVPRETESALVDALRQATDGVLRVSYHRETGAVRFIGADRNTPVRLPAQSLAPISAEQAAQAYVDTYGTLFGVDHPDRDLSLIQCRSLEDGRSVVRFRQEYQGIPVLGGELLLNLDRSLRLISAVGEMAPVDGVSTVPLASAQDARQSALGLVGKQYQVPLDDLDADDPALWYYNPLLLGAPGPHTTRLVWQVRVSTTYLSDVRELVLVDAITGTVVLHFGRATTALNRLIYDGGNDRDMALPGAAPIRLEGQGATGLRDADLAYAYAGDTYAFYASLGRDSIDGAGMPLISTVRYCSHQYACPYENAFWSGQQMVYGQGIIADDVVAHEMTHGVTEYTSGLYYYMQSGAINEGFSDAFGEFVDLTNGAGDDGADVRWWIGEDLPRGIPSIPIPLRRMDDPTATGDPDRMTSTYYVCGGTNDYGGVHSNCGVMSKAVYLMTDGGSFNGWQVDGLGISKVARILYEAQTNLLTSAADYADLYDALVQAATNLIGVVGIMPDDIEQVRRACLATEMHLQPLHCAASECVLCDSDSPNAVFQDDLEFPLSGNWVTGSMTGGVHWYYPQTNDPYSGYDATYATSGAYNIWGDADLGGFGRSDSFIAMKRDVLLPARAYLRFNHAFAFEWGGATLRPDGGVIEYSTDRGLTWGDAGHLCIDNGYTGIISGSTGNPLSGRSAFVGESNGYISTRLDLSALAGQTIRFRFRLATDDSGGNYGWFIDDIMIYTCEPMVPTVTPSPQPTLPPRAPMNLALVYKDYPQGPREMIATLDFEGALPGGWLAVDGPSAAGEYLWGKSPCRVRSGSYSGWAFGGGASGSGLFCGSTYPDGLDSWLIYGPFSLEGATRAGLTLDAWWHSEQGYDHLAIMASDDGATFYGPLFSGDSGGWINYTLDLTDVYVIGDLCGEPSVWVAVIFDSDESVGHAEGAYVDNISVWQINTPSAARSRLAVVPTPTRPPQINLTFGIRTLPR